MTSEENAKQIDELQARVNRLEGQIKAVLGPRPGPSIEVKMRIRREVDRDRDGQRDWMWKCHLGDTWIGDDESETKVVGYATPRLARLAGNAWLAILGAELGIFFKPYWIEMDDSLGSKDASADDQGTSRWA